MFGSARRSILWCGPVGLLFVAIGLVGCLSNGLVVESVNDYTTGGNWGPGADLSNSIANGDGFIKAMTPPDSDWNLTYRFTDRNVWDTDFSQGDNWDALYFDKPGTAISYYTGHGLTTAYDEVPVHRCTSSSQCTNPPPGASLPGVCKAAGSPNYAPGDTPRCVYYSDRILAVNGSKDQFGHVVNYSGGQVAWGESPNSGSWRNVGTNGGTNLVVLDASFGVLATYWVRQTISAMAGAHMLATIMPVTGDTANVADRGGYFAGGWAQNPDGAVSDAWLTTMNSIPGSGINGGAATLSSHTTIRRTGQAGISARAGANCGTMDGTPRATSSTPPAGSATGHRRSGTSPSSSCNERCRMRKHSNGLAALLFLAGCATPQVPPAPRPGPIAGSNGDAPGYQHGGTEVSKFVTGDHTEWILQHGYIRQAGDEGTIAISAGNGSVFSVPNATASALRSPAYGASPRDHERYVRDYFVGLGLPASQVKDIRTMTLLEATGRAGEINNPIPRVTAYYSVLERDIDGVAVPDSFAWARVNTDGRVVQEGVYWPSLPARAVADAMKLRDLLARPATRRALSARLPVDAASGVVTIRHSSANEDEFEAFASLDAQCTCRHRARGP